jgi:hypothetical protein
MLRFKFALINRLQNKIAISLCLTWEKRFNEIEDYAIVHRENLLYANNFVMREYEFTIEEIEEEVSNLKNSCLIELEKEIVKTYLHLF